MFHVPGIFLTLQKPHFQLVVQNLMHFEPPPQIHDQFHHPDRWTREPPRNKVSQNLNFKWKSTSFNRILRQNKLRRPNHTQRCNLRGRERERESITRYHGTSLLMDSIKAESCIHDPASLCFKKCCSAWNRYQYDCYIWITNWETNLNFLIKYMYVMIFELINVYRFLYNNTP